MARNNEPELPEETEPDPASPESIILSARDQQAFAEMLLNPPKPSRRLIAAAHWYKKQKLNDNYDPIK